MQKLFSILFALIATSTASAVPYDNSAAPILQWFEASWNTMNNRAPDLFVAGYGGVWTPPPGRGIYTVAGGGIGYDVYDRFDLGKPNDPTLYGTETGYKNAVQTIQRSGGAVYADYIINHASSFDSTDIDGNGVSFTQSGGNPGFALSLPSDVDGDFHPNPPTEFQQGDPEWEYQFQLAQLYDIDGRKNHQFIRQPVTPGDPNNIPNAGTAAFELPEFDLATHTASNNPTSRLANLPIEENRRFYSDQTSSIIVNDHVPGDPFTPDPNITIYNFSGNETTGGVPVTENSTGYLMRHARWMVQEIGVDGFRVDAARHVYPFVHDFFDRAVFLADQRTNLDGSPRHVFSFLESFTGDKAALQTFVSKDINPADLSTVGGNRDVLDLPLFFALRDNLSNNGFQNNWHNIRNASQDVQDDGLANNGSQAIAFVSSHDEHGAHLSNVAHAYVLTRPGNVVIYHNAREFNADPTVDERPFPRDGRADALGGTFGDAITTLNSIRLTHGRGDFLERWIDDSGNPGGFSNVYAFERKGSMIVGLNSRLDAGFDERANVQTSFAAGTLLMELTGNAADPMVDTNGDIPEVITVGAGGMITLRTPRNQSFGGQQHNNGYVIYGLATPQGTLSLSNVSQVLAGESNPTPQNNPVSRLTDIDVISADSFNVTLDTVEVNLLGNPALRDHDADGDGALLKIDSGIDVNNSGGVDNVTPNTPTYGFENFVTVNNPGYFANGGSGGNGQFVQTIDATQLSEGIHFIETRAFRHRDDVGPEVFSSFKKVVYIDRLDPVSAVQQIMTVGSAPLGDRDVYIESLDFTAENVHVFLNLAASVSDQDIIAMANGGQGTTSQIDVNLFSRSFNGMANGNNVFSVVTIEPTGTTNVQRFAGQSIAGAGGGLGDLNFNNSFDPEDMAFSGFGFEAVLYSQNTQFNPAADVNGDGLVDSNDLFAMRAQLILAGASMATLDEFDAMLLRRGNVDQSSSTNASDIDFLYGQFGSTDWLLDVNSDGVVNQNDVAVLVQNVFGTDFGDTNLDGAITIGDFHTLRDNAGLQMGWAFGNFDGDQHIDIDDFFTIRDYFVAMNDTAAVDEMDAWLGTLTPGAVGIPEPSTSALLIMSFCLVVVGGGRRCWQRPQRSDNL